MIIGGSAGFNSVTLYSDNYRVTAIQRKDRIELIENVTEEEKLSYINELMGRIPFVRGIWVVLKDFFVLWRLLLLLFLGILLYFVLNSNLIDGSTVIKANQIIENNFVAIQLISVIFIGLIIIKFTPLGRSCS